MKARCEALARKLRAMPEGIQAAMEDFVPAFGEYAVQVARIIAPIDTGALRRGIVAEGRGSMAVAEVSTVSYGAKVELGSSYTRPQPYLLPTAQAVRGEFAKGAVRALREVWK